MTMIIPMSPLEEGLRLQDHLLKKAIQVPNLNFP